MLKVLRQKRRAKEPNKIKSTRTYFFAHSALFYFSTCEQQASWSHAVGNSWLVIQIASRRCFLTNSFIPRCLLRACCFRVCARVTKRERQRESGKMVSLCSRFSAPHFAAAEPSDFARHLHGYSSKIHPFQRLEAATPRAYNSSPQFVRCHWQSSLRASRPK